MCPQPSSEQPSETTRDDDRSREQLRQIDDGLQRLDQSLEAHGREVRQLPATLSGELPAAAKARLADLQTALDDLATDNRNLHLQLTAVIDALEARAGTPAAPAATPELEPAGGSRWRRLAGRTLRATVGVARQAWRASHRPAATVRLVERARPTARRPKISALVQQVPEDRLLAALRAETEKISELLVADGAGWRPVDLERGELASAEAVDPRALQDRAETVVVANAGLLGRLLPGALETALLTLRIEDLQLLELQLPAEGAQPPASLILVEAGLWHPEFGLDPRAVTAFGKAGDGRKVLGKIVPLGQIDHTPPTSRLTLADGIHRVGRYLVFAKDGGVIEHSLRTLEDPSPGTAANSPAGDTVLIVLSNPLHSGLDRLLAELLRGLGQEYRFLLASCEAPGSDSQLHRDRLSLLGSMGCPIFPLSRMADPAAHGEALRGLARRYSASRVVWIGDPIEHEPPARDGDLLASFANLSAVRKLHLPWTGQASPHADLALRMTSDLAAAEPGSIPLTATAAAAAPVHQLRQELGSSGDSIVVALIADLVAEQRVEDLLAISHRLADDRRFHFVLAGRGPLAGSIDELAGYLGLRQFQRLALAPAQVLAIADIVLTTAEPGSPPLQALDALAAGRPVVGCGLGALLADGTCGVAVDCGDVEGFVAALRQLADPGERQRRGEQARHRLSGRETKSSIEAWRQALQPAEGTP